MDKLTFKQLQQVKPELTLIKRSAQGWYQTVQRWTHYELLKSAMCKCVGMTAEKGLPQFMYTTEAYDVAHHAIFKEGQDLSEPKEGEEE